MSLKSPIKFKYLLKELVEVGVNTLPLVLLISSFIGIVTGINTFHQLKKFQLEDYIGSIISLSMCIEIGPVFTAIAVAARVGSATTAKIATMKINEQIDALEVLAINPIKYLVLPKLLATFIMMPILTSYANFVGIFAGYIVVVYVYKLSPRVYIRRAMDALSSYDIFVGLIKSVFFGVGVMIVCSSKGFKVRGGAEGVGRVTTSAIVTSCALILFLDYLLTSILY